MNPNSKSSLSQLIKKSYLGPALALLIGILICEALAFLLLSTKFKEWEKTRQLLRGEITPPPNFSLCMSQPYLLYIPSPNYVDAYGIQHNAHGYRGKLVPLDKQKGVTRILCLGGSTTYGHGVPKADESYPARLESLLNQGLPEPRYEVINAGIPWGTTAENLTHYHFKFHYYKPDVVILNVGGNDAVGLLCGYYSPDYSNWRKPMFLPQPLPPLGRKVLRSRLASLLLVPLLYGEHPSESFIRSSDLPPEAEWYSRSNGRNPQHLVPKIPEDELAFKHNLEALLDELANDKCKVLLVPFRPSPTNSYPEGMREAMKMEERILKQLAEERHLGFAPFPASVVSPGNWLDNCHQNSEGLLEKARYLLPHIKSARQES